MNPKRGEVVTVAASGDFGKPRPAVVIRSDVFSGAACVGDCLPDDLQAGRRAGLPADDRTFAGKRSAGDIPDHGRQARDGPAGEDRLANRPVGPARYDAVEQHACLRVGIGGLARLRLRPTRYARRPFLARACRAPPTRRSLVPSRRKPLSETWLNCEDRRGSRRLARLRPRPTRHARRPFLARACRTPSTRRSLVPSRRKPLSETWLNCEDRRGSRRLDGRRDAAGVTNWRPRSVIQRARRARRGEH